MGHLVYCSLSEPPPRAAFGASGSQDEVLQVFSADARSPKQLRHFRFLSVSFMSQLLASSHFIRKVMCSLNVCDPVVSFS